MKRLLSMASWLGAGVCGSACGVARAIDTTSTLAWSSDTLMLDAHKLKDLSDTTVRRNIVARPYHVRASGALAFVADVGNDRVAVLDTSGEVVRWIGSHGRGPGELFGIGNVAIDGNRLLVAEAMNGRVSEFRTSGEFVRSYASPFSASSIVAKGDETLLVSASETHVATRLAAHGPPTLALPRRTHVTDAEQRRWSAMRTHNLLAPDTAGVWMFDQVAAELCHYARNAARPRCLALPADLVQRLRRYRDARVGIVERETHQHVWAAPIVKDMIRVGGLIALLLPLPDLPIALIDPDDGSLTPAMLIGPKPPSWVRASGSFAWDGHAFVAVGEEAIGRLYISRSATH